MAKLSCGSCQPCMARKPDFCEALLGAGPRNGMRSGAAVILQVSPSELHHQWVDRVRGRVGSLLRMPWWVARQKVTHHELRAWYDAGETPQAVADRIVGAWMLDQQFEAPLV